MADIPNTSFKMLGITSNIGEGQYVSESGVMQSRRYGAQRFSMSLEYAPLSKAEFMPVEGFLEGRVGRSTTFEIPLPYDQLSAVTGSPVTNGARARGSNSVPIDNITASLTNAFYAGDYINFSTHAKAYKIVSTVDAGASESILDEVSGSILDEVSGDILDETTQQATVTIFPPLIEDLADGSGVTYGSSFRFTVRQSSDVQTYNVEPPYIYAKQIDVTEYIA